MRFAYDDRLTRVHEAVVTSYIRSGAPVGSRYVWSHFDFGLSPASIRGVMAELEDLGLLEKPHTSAGRVPTEKGYRVYVDRLIKKTPVRKSDADSIRRAVNRAASLRGILEGVCRSLESLSHQTGVAVAPKRGNGVVRRMEVARMGPRRLAVTVLLEPGTERTVSLKLDSDAAGRSAASELGRLTRTIAGRSVKEALRVLRETSRSKQRSARSSSAIWKSVADLLTQGVPGVHVFGTGNLVSAMDSTAEAGSLLEVLESRESIVNLLLSDRRRAGTDVSIGSENKYRPMRSCSIIRSTYRVGDTTGAIGIIGPLRMEYPRFMALVEYASNELTRFLAMEGGDRRRKK
jgi:heat-inducible transcriptional repressor